MAITFVICLLALLVPLSALADNAHPSGQLKSLAKGERPLPSHPVDTSVPDEDQPEESGKTAISAMPVEEEVKAKHELVDLTSILNRAHPVKERVDHAYEAWFYTVTHPPLTPPPNA